MAKRQNIKVFGGEIGTKELPKVLETGAWLIGKPHLAQAAKIWREGDTSDKVE